MYQGNRCHKKFTKEKYKHYMNSRRNGFGLNLYRNTQDKVLGGVCAGIGDHFEIEHNIMRVIAVATLVFTGPLAFWAYIIGWIVLVPKKTHTNEEANYEYDEDEQRYRPKKMFRYRESTHDRLRKAKQRLNDIAARVESMEHHVTSNKFQLNRKFADLER